VVPIADAHSDLLMELVHAEHRLGERNPLRSRWLAPLERGGVALQVCAIYVGGELLPEGGLREALRQATAFAHAVRDNDDRVVAIHAAGDLESIGDGRTGLLLALEGADCLGAEPWAIEPLARLGVRMVSLTWSRRNAFADGTGGDAGLTALGRELVDRIVGLGLMLDLAHAAERTFWEALERASGAPVLVSHAACRALHDHERNLSDAQLRALAQAGGVLCVMPHPFTIGPEQATLDRAIDHIVHAVSVMGIEHVALGGDFLRQIARATHLTAPAHATGTLAPDSALEGLAGPEEYPRLIDALRARGYDEAGIAAVARENLLRLVRDALTQA
jgi:membrane dipeptidase